MKKWKVLVVDDELPIRKMFANYRWEENGFQYVGSAHNGRTALEICRQVGKTPDIVIVDITMPVMDGFELIEHLEKEFPEICFIVLTCHQDFVYAKKAIQYNAIDYLLKSDISEEAVMTVMKKAVAELEQIYANQGKKMYSHRLKLAGLLMAKEPDLDSIRLEMESIRFNISDQTIFFCLFLEYNGIFGELVRYVVRESFSLCPFVMNWLIIDDNCYGVQFFEEPFSHAEELLSWMKERIESEIPVLADCFSLYGALEDTGGDYSCIMDILSLIPQWRAAHFISPKEKIFTGVPPIFYQSGDHDEDELCELLKDADMGNIVEQFVRWGQERYLYPDVIKRLLKSCLKRQYGVREMDPLMVEVSEASDLYALAECLQGYLERQTGNYMRYEIRQVCRIIATEFATELTLPSVAKSVGLSPPYLSRLFKETMGEGFAEYLIRVRMEKAQQMLMHSEKKIYEIAEAVGIPSYRYFSIMYKKFYGKTPSEQKTMGRKI